MTTATTNTARKNRFCGELYEDAKDGGYIGCIYAVEGGFIVRVPDGMTKGPVAYGGKVFAASEFKFVRTFRLSAARSVKQYCFAAVRGEVTK